MMEEVKELIDVSLRSTQSEVEGSGVEGGEVYVKKRC